MRVVGVVAGAFVALFAAASAGAQTTFVVEGRGWGHGVGLSQYGAYGYARHGWGYERILAHYYRGTALSSRPNRIVRVLVAEGRPRLLVGSGLPFRRVVRGERSTLRSDRRLSPAAVARLGGVVRYEPGASPLRVDGTPYRGSIVVYVAAGRLYAVNHVSLDHYLRGVVPWEVPFYWPREMLRAQAVVARSYALATLSPGRRYDVLDDTRDQVYGGILAERRSTNSAVASTAGRVVTWHGEVATTYYHSTSGGRTASSADVFSDVGAVPYLVSVPDPYDSLSPKHRWPARQLSPAALGRLLHVGAVRDLLVTLNGSGRPGSVQAVGAKGTRVLTDSEFRDALGLGSGWFTVAVLSLEGPHGADRPGRPVRLEGLARSGEPARLQKAVGSGAWEPVRRLQVSSGGRFETSVRPTATTRYRLVAGDAEGPVVEVRVRR